MHRWVGLVVAICLPTHASANTSVGDHQTVTVDCAKDSHVDIGGSDNTVTVVGDCFVIVVAGNRNKVTGSSTTNLGISGGHNTVTLTVGEHLFVLGDDNAVTWKPRDTKKAPELSDGGKRNVVVRAK